MVLCETIDDRRIFNSDAIVLFIINEDWGRKTIKDIKSMPALFLKPLLTVSQHHLESISNVTDEEIIVPALRSTLIPKIEKVRTIVQKINKLTDISDTEDEERIRELLILRFFYTRNDFILKPIRDLNSITGYSYPIVQSLTSSPPGKEIETLEGLEDFLLLKGKLSDKTHACPFCEHYQINFREVCTKCHSLRIDEEPTIHHYRCAYVGREKEFIQEGNLICPKCNREIRHIGVDYDKPSEDFWCDECGNNFSEPLISCFCLSCGKTFPPEDLFSKQIKEFSLTHKGAQSAEEGILPRVGLMGLLRKDLVFYNSEIFRELLKIEMLRCRRYQYGSVLVRLSIGNFEKILEEEGLRQAQKLRKEIAALFKSTFRETDIITDISDTVNLIVLTNTDSAQATISMERLKQNGRTIFREPLNFEYRLTDLKTETASVEDVLGDAI